MACNIKYRREQKSLLATDLKLLYNQINRPGIEDRIIKTLEFKYRSKEGENKKLLLTDPENIDEIALDFISGVNDIICSLTNTEIDKLPEKARKFRNIVLSTFFDMNSVGEVTTQISETEKEMETDKELEVRKLQKIEDTLLEIYGPVNTGLIYDVMNSFGRELKQKLIYNNYLKIKYTLNSEEVNKRITEYKKEKFNNILNYLKDIYPDDSFLLSINELYSNRMLNSNLYYYVIDVFKKHILSDPNRNIKFINLLENKILLKNKIKQESSYRLLINIVLNNSELKTWFNNTYNTEDINSEAKYVLFMSDRFSNYYLEIKDRLLKGLDRLSEKDQILDLILEIENPENNLLNYVNDYVILTLFDSLLSYKLGSNIGIEKGFLFNIEPQRLDAKKYILKESHKHQKAGWETSNSEGSEDHTSTEVKDILDTIFIHKYNESHQSLSQTLDMTSLMLAWQSFITDILNNNINFDENQTARDTIKLFINTMDNNVVDNITNILQMLFEPTINGRLIDSILGETLFSEQHKNILYSFYNGVLNKNNLGSHIAIESRRINDPVKYSSTFLETVSDLCSILYRNVNNNYIDCDIRASKSKLTIKRKFNWDSELFDLVERINFRSKTRLLNKLGEKQLSKYNYKSSIDSVGKYTSTVEIPGKNGKLYTFGFKYNQGIVNVDGLFSNMNNIDLENSTVTIKDKEKDKEVPLLDILADINLRDFSNKVLANKALLNEYETVLSNLLEMFDYYLNTNLLSDKGLEALLQYKSKYQYNAKNGLYSNNYLEHFLKLAIRTADIDDLVRLSDGDMRKFLKEGSKYTGLFTRESNKSVSDIFQIQANKVYIKPVTSTDKALSDLTRSLVEVTGKSVRSTSLNKEGSSVSNYSISRSGSELNRRLYRQKQEGGAASTLLFVLNPDAIDVDPVIDSEITTITGDVKVVKDMSTTELFQHAIFDKFYLSFIKTGKVCFQPTVYSDKTNFLNYMAKLSMFSKNVMDLMNDTELEFIDLYRNTFFAAHLLIQSSIVNKYQKLIEFLDTKQGLNFKKLNDVFGVNLVDDARTFLRNRTLDELMNLVYNYNLYNDEKIELEMDKDYRSRGNFCDLNEIVDFYVKAYEDPDKLRTFIKQLQAIFLNDLRDYGVTFKLFNSIKELNSWINGKLEERKSSYIVRLLSSTKILGAGDRAKFADQWVNKSTGELILERGGKMNPLLEKFFYIEGIFSNNLRLSLSGSEINHPDKASDTLFNTIKSQIKNIEEASTSIETTEAINKLQDTLNKNGITYSSINNFIKEFSKFKAIDDLDGKMQVIYDKSIINIINTAEGTLFKRNVIIPATLLHPILGLINGVANKVNVATIYDMKAPVNNLRGSDKIDSQDGSARMSPILVLLENKSLGDLRVGTNRKPIWDDQTDDLTSFLAKFAAFGYTNATMLQSLQSTSSEYNMFKKMHNIRWNGSIDLTKNINLFLQTLYDQKEVSRWFKEAILEGQKLFYRDKFGKIVQITDFGKDESGYFTIEKIPGKKATKVYHYFSDVTSEHSTTGGEGFHTIDSLYELFVALGGINCTDAKGVISEFSNLVLTNFVINVGYKNKVNIKSVDDIEQPLKDKFIAYVLNNSAVKNGAKNINNSNSWIDDTPLNTFQVNMRGLGILLNADHDVVDLELTEFSQVVSACAAYGKYYDSLNEIYYSLAKSAFEASKYELTNIENYFKDYAVDPSKAKYQLYKIVGKLIVQSRSNSDMDLSLKLKLEINLEFKINKDNSSLGLKIPFSDPSIYRLFITNITSVINSKSIKRKHPGSGYVMAPGYNIVLYFLLYDSRTKTYRKYLFADILKRARNDFRGKLINKLEKWCKLNGVDPNKYGEQEKRIVSLDLPTLIEECKDKIDFSNIPYININVQDITEYNKLLVNTFLSIKLNTEQLRDKSWFMPTDIVDIIKSDGSIISHTLDSMEDYYKFKNGLFDIEDEYNVKIALKENKYTISLKEDPNSSFVIEKEFNSDKWNIHFKTGSRDANLLRRTPWGGNEELKIRLFNAALQALPNGAVLRLSPTTLQQLATKIGGLTKGSVVGYQSILNNLERRQGVELEVASDPYAVFYFDKNGNINTTEVSEYRKIRNISDHQYRLNIIKPNNLKPSLIRWRYKHDEDLEQLQITKSEVYNKPWESDPTKFNKAFTLSLDEDPNIKFEIVKDNEANYWYIEAIENDGTTYELTEAQKERLLSAAVSLIPVGDYLGTLGELNPNRYGFTKVGEKNVSDIKISIWLNTGKYMNIFDHPIIRGSWNLPKNLRPKLSEIQKVLDLLEQGKFELNNKSIDIIPRSLENTEAELVLGNMYKDIFQTGDNSLADIMDQGEDFFRKQTEIPSIPSGFYNLAFVKNNGLHTLISFSDIIETMNIYEDPFDYTLEYVNEDNEIYNHEEGIKIGKYIPSSWKYVDGKVLNLNNEEIDESRYKLILDDLGNVESILERIDYVKRYKYTKPEWVNGLLLLINYTLYKISRVSEIKRGLNKRNADLEVLNWDVHHLISSILKNIYSLDRYIDIQVNTTVKLNPDLLRNIANNLIDLGNDTKYDEKSNKRVLMTPEEIKKLPMLLQHVIAIRNALLGNKFLEEYLDIKSSYYEYLQQYKKLYSSFLSSLHFISSRIPAQSLLSFMPMICVGWTSDTSNTAYVSHFLTYLQGSKINNY